MTAPSAEETYVTMLVAEWFKDERLLALVNRDSVRLEEFDFLEGRRLGAGIRAAVAVACVPDVVGTRAQVAAALAHSDYPTRRYLLAKLPQITIDEDQS